MNIRSQMLLFKGMISELPNDTQLKVHEIAAKVRELIGESEEGPLAFALVGLELQMKAES